MIVLKVTGGQFAVVATVFVIFVLVLWAIKQVMAEMKSYKNPLMLTVDEAGKYFHVMDVEKDLIQLRLIIMAGSVELPLSREILDEICRELPDIAPEPHFWYKNGNISFELREKNKIFKVINQGGKVGFKILN